MVNILNTIADYAKIRVSEAKEKVSFEEIKEKALALPKGDFEFEKALAKKGISFICECKKASPSKGIIAEDFPYVQIAKDYEAAGADCISVLTEPKWFMGSNQYLKEISENVSIPIIRKDFLVDSYMIYEAKVIGAKAVLLICSILDEKQIKDYIGIADSLGLSCLVEAHDEDEIAMALRAGARIIGVNNRNLKDFTVDINNSVRLRKLVPSNVLFVSESGMKTREDIKTLEENGTNAVLIGETFMRSNNKAAMLNELAGKEN
ncbi:MAG: indole-3-glycerol phosphate synthase TrpC [Lachnospiraceae bacterium]|nr:indole-3-glycerol phosphate synthase TrpC [Lachnospiraceae bacterium]